jgi:hypothetical protein
MAQARSRQTTGIRRRSTVSGSGAIDDLTNSVNELIRENKALKAQLARFTGNGGWPAAPRQLIALQRNVMRAMTGGATTRTRRVRATTPVTTTAPQRKITDPAVLERRRASLAKARAARSAKAKQRSR